MVHNAGVTPARLRTFVAVADAGSVRGAAASLVVSESAVSAAVGALSRAVGVALVSRDGRGLALTDAGAAFVPYARQVLGLVAEGAAAATAADDATRGQLRLAAVTSAAEVLLPPLLSSFTTRFPDVGLTLQVGTRDETFAALDAHRADLVIAGRPTSPGRAVTRALRANTLLVVARPAGVGGVDALSATWLLRESGAGTRDAALGLLTALQVTPRTLTLGSQGAVIAGVREGLGVALVSRDAVWRELAAGELIAVDLPGTPLQRPWHAVTGASPTPTTQLFVAHLTDPGAAGEQAFVSPRRRAARAAPRG